MRGEAQGSRRTAFLELARSLGAVSRGDLARETRLDKKTVSGIVDRLLAEGILSPAGFRESSVGRRQELLAVRGEYANCVGIDLGATHVIGILADLRGQPLDRVFFAIRPDLPADLILDQMKSVARALLASPKTTAPVRALGICVPGFVNPSTGTSLIAENIPGWRDVRLGEVFRAEFGLPVRTDDASRSFGLAEQIIGAGRGREDFLALDLGYGIGMAIVVRGRLYEGSGWKSGEIGHVVVDPDGAPCACGNRGCLETVASGRAIARRAAKGIRAGKTEVLAGLTHGNAESVTAQDVALAAGMQDPFAVGLLRDAGERIGLALANAVNLLNPSAVILGGGLASSHPAFVETIQAGLRTHAMPGIRDDMELLVSRLGIDGSALGAVHAAADAVLSAEKP
jgi:N-acetylglucosamine repressor